MIEGGRTRPLYVAMSWTAVRLFGANPVMWHSYGVVLLLCATLSVQRFLRSVIERVAEAGAPSVWTTTAAAACWMLFPWGMGYSAWPVMFPGLWLVIFFSLMGERLMRRDCTNLDVRWACYWFALACLTYETFWFAFLPLVALQCAITPACSWRRMAEVLLPLSTIQVLAVAWNLGMTSLSETGAKQFNRLWYEITARSMRDLPSALATAFDLATLVTAPGIGITAVAAAFIIVVAWRVRGIALIGACVAGVAISSGLYAAAGYGIVTTGVFSRTTLGISVWLAIFLAGGFTALLEVTGRRGAPGSLIACVALLTVIAAGNLRQTVKWAEAWQLQQKILRAMPRAVRELEGSVMLVADLPRVPGGIETFEAPWDITAALQIHAGLPQSALATVVRSTDWRSTWDGKRLTQAWCSSLGSPLWELPATTILIWTHPEAELATATPPWSTGCEAKR